MTAAKIRVELLDHSARFYGSPRLLMPAFKAVQCRRQFDTTRKCWVIPRASADDVLAALDDRVGGDIQVGEVLR